MAPEDPGADPGGESVNAEEIRTEALDAALRALVPALVTAEAARRERLVAVAADEVALREVDALAGVVASLWASGASGEAEFVASRIAATVAMMVPSGYVVIEPGAKSINDMRDEWEARLTQLVQRAVDLFRSEAY